MLMPNDFDNVEGRYSAGFTAGYWQEEMKENHPLYSDGTWIGEASWFDEMWESKDEHFWGGFVDGENTRQMLDDPSNPFVDGGYFSANLSGFPWGSSIERAIEDSGTLSLTGRNSGEGLAFYNSERFDGIYWMETKKDDDAV